MFVCPVCGRKSAGRVAADQYYCWECCVEFVMKGEKVTRIYNVELDGSLSDLDNTSGSTTLKIV